MEPWTIIDKFMFGAMRWLAEKSTNFFVKLKVTQNQVTFFGSMVFLPLSALAFSQGNYRGNLLGLLFVFLHSYSDFIDGTLARKTNTFNKLGKWSDPAFDLVGSGLLLGGISLGVLRQFSDFFWLVVVVLALFGHYGVLVVSYDYKKEIYGEKSQKILLRFKKTKTNLIDFLIKEFLFLQSFIFLFLGTLRYSLLLFAILNKLHYFLIIFAIFNNFRWLVMFFAYTQALNQPGTKIPMTNLKIIKMLRQELLKS